ncbi:MAG: phosphoglycolate phosphatase [Methanomicrobiaceae archaeon]|nr:phosphoglycolate phosphatase [Methanomicrobiaceae archaeon]MDD5418407.1 phosphoglycolate phosphatase [Methanomicrobiaceae archaeon]
MLKAVVTDVDGTITDMRRRISTDAIECIRDLVDGGIDVVIASGNTCCFMDGLCRMIGTNGSIIGENGGIYRNRFAGKLHILGDRQACWTAFRALQAHFAKSGTELELYSPDYRFADVAFARTIDADEVRQVLKQHPVRVLDTGFAIHLQSHGVNKGIALIQLAEAMGLHPSEFLAIGDSMNDVEMLAAAGVGVAVKNSHPDTKAIADYVTKKRCGDGFVEAVKRFYADFLSR